MAVRQAHYSNMVKELLREFAVFNTCLFRDMLFCNIKTGLNDDNHDVSVQGQKYFELWYWAGFVSGFCPNDVF